MGSMVKRRKEFSQERSNLVRKELDPTRKRPKIRGRMKRL